MTYRESRAQWRKAWRREPGQRQMELSHHARMLPGFLLIYADDAGCLGPAAGGSNPARILAERMSIGSRNRKAFYREVKELLDYGDDGEPLALVVRDAHFYLTRFEECQANRTGQSPGQSLGQSSRQSTGQSPSNNPPESHNTETDLAREERGKKKELRTHETGKESKGRPDVVDHVLAYWHAAELPAFADLGDDGRRRIIANRLSDGCTVADLKAAIDGAKRSTLGKRDLPVIFRNREAVEQLRDQPLNREQLEAQKAEQRIKAEQRHSADVQAKCEENEREAYRPSPEEWAALEERTTRKASEQREKNGVPNPIGALIDLSSVIGRGR